MGNSKVFFDTNILLYLLSEDHKKADCSEHLLSKGGVISVQVLNEFVSVASRKLKMNYLEIRDILDSIRSIVTVQAMNVETHDSGLDIAEKYKFSFYDSLIIASALKAGCDTLYTEDLQHQQRLEKRLTVVNPFVVAE
jgi:predicted nucleic acid-binding protein